MSLEDRKRKIIHKLTFQGVPLSWAREYILGRFKSYRKDNPEFDVFLDEIGELLKAEKNDDYANLIKLINNEGEGNWITPSKSMLTAFVKLYNLCLSPKQAFAYIKKCLTEYKKMSNNTYQLCDKPQLSIRRSRWDGRESKFISFSVKPKTVSKNWDYIYWFDITTSLKMIEDCVNDITTHVDEFILRCHNDMLEDALMLFEYHQNKNFLRKVFETGIKELVKQGIIRETIQKDFYGWIIHQYETDMKISDKEDDKND